MPIEFARRTFPENIEAPNCAIREDVSTMADFELSSVDTTTKALQKLLAEARRKKGTVEIEPPLAASDVTGLIERTEELSSLRVRLQDVKDASRQAHFARIETAVRNIFNSLLVCMALLRQLYEGLMGGNSIGLDLDRRSSLCPDVGSV